MQVTKKDTDLVSKCTKSRLAVWLRPDRWRSLQRSPRPTTGFKGGKKEREKKEEEGLKGRGREGRERKWKKEGKRIEVGEGTGWEVVLRMISKSRRQCMEQSLRLYSTLVSCSVQTSTEVNLFKINSFIHSFINSIYSILSIKINSNV